MGTGQAGSIPAHALNKEVEMEDCYYSVCVEEWDEYAVKVRNQYVVQATSVGMAVAKVMDKILNPDSRRLEITAEFLGGKEYLIV